jgi:hypothetical protein
MKALFYNLKRELVWECTQDAKYYLNKGTEAIQKGAKFGILLDATGKEIDRAQYGPF